MPLRSNTKILSMIGGLGIKSLSLQARLELHWSDPGGNINGMWGGTGVEQGESAPCVRTTLLIAHWYCFVFVDETNNHIISGTLLKENVDAGFYLHALIFTLNIMEACNAFTKHCDIPKIIVSICKFTF